MLPTLSIARPAGSYSDRSTDTTARKRGFSSWRGQEQRGGLKRKQCRDEIASSLSGPLRLEIDALAVSNPVVENAVRLEREYLFYKLAYIGTKQPPTALVAHGLLGYKAKEPRETTESQCDSGAAGERANCRPARANQSHQFDFSRGSLWHDDPHQRRPRH